MSRIYDSLRRAEDKQAQREARGPDAPEDGTRELAEDISSVAAAVKRIEQRLESELGETREEAREQFAALEVSIGAIEDLLDEQPGEAATQLSDELRTQLSGLATSVREMTNRIEHEIPSLRAEFNETIDKRVQSAVAQLLGREQTTRDRLEARMDALRRDLDGGLRRHAILIGAVLLIGFVAYAC